MANNRNGGVDRPTCSFCGRDENHVNFMIPSPTGLLICDHCIDICNEIIDEQLGGDRRTPAAEAVGLQFHFSRAVETPPPEEARKG